MLQLADRYSQFTAAWKVLYGDHPVPPLALFETRYAQSHRHYHTANHILRLLNMQVEVGRLLGNRLSVEEEALIIVAIWFHDIVYDVPAGILSNEAASAKVFRECAPESAATVKIGAMIELSTHMDPVLSSPGYVMIFLDLDLLGLADPVELFSRSTDLCRAEFSHLSERDWAIGRTQFWYKLLARKIIFYNSYELAYFAAAEERARNNIGRELRRLQAQQQEQ